MRVGGRCGLGRPDGRREDGCCIGSFTSYKICSGRPHPEMGAGIAKKFYGLEEKAGFFLFFFFKY